MLQRPAFRQKIWNKRGGNWSDRLPMRCRSGGRIRCKGREKREGRELGQITGAFKRVGVREGKGL